MINVRTNANVDKLFQSYYDKLTSRSDVVRARKQYNKGVREMLAGKYGAEYKTAMQVGVDLHGRAPTQTGAPHRDHVYLAPSHIPGGGYGVFAGKTFAPGDAVVAGTGEILPTPTSDQFYSFSMEGAAFKNLDFQTVLPRTNTIMFFNSAVSTGRPANVEILWLFTVPVISATAPVNAGDELLLNYDNFTVGRKHAVEPPQPESDTPPSKRARTAPPAHSAPAYIVHRDRLLRYVNSRFHTDVDSTISGLQLHVPRFDKLAKAYADACRLQERECAAAHTVDWQNAFLANVRRAHGPNPDTSLDLIDLAVFHRMREMIE